MHMFTDGLLDRFPTTFPSTVEVPSWAKLDISKTGNIFDPVAAAREAAISALPPISSLVTTSSTQAPISGTQSQLNPSTTASSPALNASSSDSGGLSPGAIAGITIGVLIIVVGVLLAIFWRMLQARKRRNAMRGSALAAVTPSFNEKPMPLSPSPPSHIHTRSLSDPASIVTPFIYNTTGASPRPDSAAPSSTYYTTGPLRSSVDDMMASPQTATSPRTIMTVQRSNTPQAQVHKFNSSSRSLRASPLNNGLAYYHCSTLVSDWASSARAEVRSELLTIIRLGDYTLFIDFSCTESNLIEGFNSQAKNNKGQDPCLVAALLQADCRNETNVTIPQLAVNEIYTGPNPANNHDVCLCNSVVYSLLSVCAACQSRFWMDWTSWTAHCAIAYIRGFPKNISSNVAVPPWAYNNITVISAPNFDMEQAIRTAVNGPQSSTTFPSTAAGATDSVTQSTGGGMPSSTILTPSFVPTDSSSDVVPDNQFTVRKSLMIVGSVVGSALAITLAALVIWCFLRRTRRRKSPPSVTGSMLYKPLGEAEIPKELTEMEEQTSFRFSPLELDITSRHPGNISTSALSHVYSRADLPSYLFHASPDSEIPHSPAVESSELFTTAGGHSSSEGHYPFRRNSSQSFGASARKNTSSTSRRGASRGSTLLSSVQQSPTREEPIGRMFYTGENSGK
ncbi:hypothetical protein NP233_g4007 [Leucocoprinus birnbaumii]|uniref:Uncharacterized protein n=1 Tax=Leucocoprinus birnbaumii TaxID=56174 RepID=A0AAD5YSA9_9AGAR|nr:hypothetical protein NP233_g4007 [Leucocoprinus birnbaumii]